MLEGKCLKCGYYCAGWALQSPRNQTCPRCGIGLEITEDGWSVSTGYSPFTADKYSIELRDNVSPFNDEEKEILKEDK
jgi:hypothetical protein